MRRRVTDKQASERGPSAREKARAVAGQSKAKEAPVTTAAERTVPLPHVGEEPAKSGRPAVGVNAKPVEGPEKRERPVGTASMVKVNQVQMDGFETIIDNLFEFDADAALEECLEFLDMTDKPSRAEYGLMVDALDDAAQKVLVAHMLLANARVQCKAFEIDADVMRATIHEQAVSELNEQYVKDVERVRAEYEGRKDKPPAVSKPTVGDIEAYKKTVYHDEWRANEVSVAKAKETCSYFEGLCKAMEGRQRDLRQMVAGARGGAG